MLSERKRMTCLEKQAINWNDKCYEYSSAPGSVSAGKMPISSQNNGQSSNYASIQTLTLGASNDGLRYTPLGAGIKIDDNSGGSEIIISHIQSEHALFDRLTVKASGETIGNAGALLHEDCMPYAWNPANANGYGKAHDHRCEHTRISIKSRARCSYSMPSRGRKHTKNILKNIISALPKSIRCF